MTTLAPSLQSVIHQISRSGVSSLRSESSDDTSQNQLEADIAQTIYDRFHARWERDPNFRVTARDFAFEAELRSVTPHQTALTDVKIIERTEAGALVTIEGVVVRLQTEVPLIRMNRQTRVEIPAVRPALSPGFLLVDGSLGRPDGVRIARFYVHLASREQAIEIWGCVLSTLENLNITYRAKVASNQGMLPRADALVVYCTSIDSSTVRAALGKALTDGMLINGVGSVFTEEIKPGLAYAEEPSAIPGGDLSFGQHRSRAVARAVVHASRQGWRGSEEILVRELEASGINPARPWEDLRSSTPK